MTPFCKSVLKNEQIIWSFYSDGEYIPQFSPKVFKRFEPKTNRAEPRLYGATILDTNKVEHNKCIYVANMTIAVYTNGVTPHCT